MAIKKIDRTKSYNMYRSNLKSGDRVLIFPIINRNFTKTELITEIKLDDSIIRLLIINGSEIQKLSPKWIDIFQNFVMRNGLDKNTNITTINREAHYLITLDPVPNEIHIGRDIELAIRLVLYPPTQIGNAINYIIDGGAGAGLIEPWRIDNFDTNHNLSQKSLEKIVSTFYLLKQIDSKNHVFLEKVLEIMKINNIYFQVGLLWNFIEGFWGQNNQNKSLHNSFKIMLTFPNGYPPDYSRKKVKEIREKIENHNNSFGKDKITSIRNFLLHGDYISAKTISEKQINIINEQRNYLYHLIIDCLINTF
ncbi:hypothetical protein GCM10009430_30460 [Aquimarina litoralis]|uniref:Apea-like HEPN domain-containing protein n=1 Tax=Aquimarina litoralis TaxID=584605 RepID=A0ABN1J0W2_9FLAO